MLDSANPIVLVVDDSPDSLGMLNSALNQGGYTVLVALSGRQALDIARQIRPNVVLMDAVMPEMDGFDCCREMRGLLPLTPILFMTGLTEEEHVVRAFESGGNDYITKPIKPQELLARISAQLSAARMLDTAQRALDMARQYVIAVDGRGRLLWSTPEARELLAERGYEGGEEALIAAIASWIPCRAESGDLVLGRDQARLRLRHFKQISDDEHLLRILGDNLLTDASRLEAALPITRREAQVLLWVAHGKTNKEIGEILSLSPRTVNKHLEQAFPKLQVDNRSAATSIAIQALLGLPV